MRNTICCVYFAYSQLIVDADPLYKITQTATPRLVLRYTKLPITAASQVSGPTPGLRLSDVKAAAGTQQLSQKSNRQLPHMVTQLQGIIAEEAPEHHRLEQRPAQSLRWTGLSGSDFVHATHVYRAPTSPAGPAPPRDVGARGGRRGKKASQ